MHTRMRVFFAFADVPPHATLRKTATSNNTALVRVLPAPALHTAQDIN